MLVRTVFNSAKQQKMRLAADAYRVYLPRTCVRTYITFPNVRGGFGFNKSQLLYPHWQKNNGKFTMKFFRAA